jgi:hypothetical protein
MVRRRVPCLLFALMLAPSVSRASDAVGTCETPEPLPRLDSYVGLAPQAKFHIDVKWNEGAADFAPVRAIAMPPHHASRLRWTNLKTWHALGQRHAQVLRFRITYLTAVIEKVPGQNRWRATYDAEINGVCVPTGVASAR